MPKCKIVIQNEPVRVQMLVENECPYISHPTPYGVEQSGRDLSISTNIQSLSGLISCILNFMNIEYDA
jgi:hypothetical protein